MFLSRASAMAGHTCTCTCYTCGLYLLRFAITHLAILVTVSRSFGLATPFWVEPWIQWRVHTFYEQCTFRVCVTM
jgi:hypothetical protein